MPLDVGRAIRDGIDRTIARNGLLLAGLLFLVNALNATVAASISPGGGAAVPGFAGPAGWTPFALSPVVAGLLALGFSLLSVVISIAAIRLFVSDETEVIPTELFTRNIGWAFLNFLIGGIVFAVIVAIGTLLLIIPGIFLLVTLIFWSVYVVVEDLSFVDGMARSWQLTAGHRLRLFLLGVVVIVIVAVVNSLFNAPAAFMGGPGGVFVSQVGSALTGVFSTATLAQTFRQLVALDAADDEPDRTGAASVDEGSDEDYPRRE